MKISVITPSFRQSEWLKLCIASVADQQGEEVEHIIQDACSDDATLEWLLRDERVQAVIEKDAGMYDAINRGFRQATGDVLAYLNCDEQLLPGALRTVARHMEAHPDVDVILGDTVVVDENGDYICHRYSLKPIASHVWLQKMPLLTCSMFLRRRVVSELGLFFDTNWRVIGDLLWVIEAIQRKVRFGTLRQFLAVFTDSGENLDLSPLGTEERRRKSKLVPRWVQATQHALVLHHRLRLLRSGAFVQRPFSYAIYTRTSPNSRVTFTVTKPTAIWRGRWKFSLGAAEYRPSPPTRATNRLL
jgi:glycosyltransferase involved in cell wall biosynthesis